jgi:hypothetical protein
MSARTVDVSLDPAATQSAILALKKKQQFYCSQTLAWSLLKTVDGVDVSTARIQLNNALTSSLTGNYECIVVRVKGHIPQQVSRILTDIKSDEFAMKHDTGFKMNKTLCSAIVGKKAFECVWVRDIGLKSPVPLFKDQEVISFYYQNMVSSQAPHNNGVTKTTEILSGSLSDSQLKELFGPDTSVKYNTSYSAGHEIFTQLRLTPIYEAPNGAPSNTSLTYVEHFGLYCSPGKPAIIYESILADTILRKYTNLIKAYRK